MDFKKTLARGALKLLEDPRVRKMAQDPRVWRGLTTAWNVRTEVTRGLDDRVRRIAKELGLATPAEIQELKRTISELRGELDEARAREEAARADPARAKPKAKPKAKRKRKTATKPEKTKTRPGTTDAPTDRSPRRPARTDPDPGSEPQPG